MEPIETLSDVLSAHADDRRGTINIGTSGWNYPEWRGKFYPEGLPRSGELEYYGQQFDTLELNSSFYRLHRPSTYEKWSAAVPSDFQFAVKGWRMITHMRRLKNVEDDLATFFGSGVLTLGEKLGPVLWQLPPSLKYDEDILRSFLSALPATYGEAMEMGGVMREPGIPDISSRPIRYSLEPRATGFDSPDVLDLFREHDVALVMSDIGGRHPEYRETTGNLVYVRLHGSPRVYFSKYAEDVLAEWAQRVEGWSEQGRDTYVYFDNTGAGWAPRDAERLVELVQV